MSEDRETIWVGYVWRWPDGWRETCRSATYCGCWSVLKALHECLNEKLLVVRADQGPPPDEPGHRRWR